MLSLKTKFAAWTAIAALGASSLLAAETTASGGARHGRHGSFLSNLGLTGAQHAQAKSIFQDARQSAQPVRQQLRETRQSLRAAVQANNASQIQQLASTEGGEIGQLAAIRSTAMAKVYQILTPDQQQKLAALRQARKAAHEARPAGAQN
jgi:Spy/CpxP family protein refolding chaperone